MTTVAAESGTRAIHSFMSEHRLKLIMLVLIVFGISYFKTEGNMTEALLNTGATLFDLVGWIVTLPVTILSYFAPSLSLYDKAYCPSDNSQLTIFSGFTKGDCYKRVKMVEVFGKDYT